MKDEIIADRMAPVVDKEFVVFIIGMRFNKLLQFKKWWFTSRAMPKMIKELEEDRSLGMMHAYGARTGRVAFLVQYWESFDKLVAYSNNPDYEHKPAWKDFYKIVGLKGDVGIWHETYIVKPGHSEAVYGNMPPFGLGKCFPLEKANGRYGDAISRVAASGAKDAAE